MNTSLTLTDLIRILTEVLENFHPVKLADFREILEQMMTKEKIKVTKRELQSESILTTLQEIKGLTKKFAEEVRRSGVEGSDAIAMLEDLVERLGFAINLDKYRDRANIPLKKLAEFSGVNYTYLHRIARCKKPIPSHDFAEKLATMLKVTPADLHHSYTPDVNEVTDELEAYQKTISQKQQLIGHIADSLWFFDDKDLDFIHDFLKNFRARQKSNSKE